MSLEPQPQLAASDLQELIMASMKSYENRTPFECFALLMGKAQILEFGLKSLLERTFAVDRAIMEKWTLGRVANELEARALRPDYIALLKQFVGHRNYIAHEMLAVNAMFKSMAGDISDRFEFGQLQGPTIELEQLLILHDWCEEYGAWLPIEAQPCHRQK